MNTLSFNIAAVERDTGLSKDVLRMWERRYGFPVPERDVNGERVYPADQVERLRLIKRLMDQGHRPGKLIGAPAEELASLSPRRPRAAETAPPADAAELAELLALIKRHDAVGYQQAMQQRLARQGLQRFVQDTIAPLTEKVGEAWENGSFEVFEEHLFTELTKRLLRQVIATLPSAGRGPRVLLTSVPEEPHVLGLLMAESMLALEGADCVPLGTQMPLLEICRAAEAHRADIVALSFSVAFPHRQIPGLLQQLRLMLPAATALWAGGRGVLRVPRQEGVQMIGSLDESLAALAAWRAAHTPTP
ncbi:MAG: MerR family transcriptional regulator [Zoogloea sp.]|nr:MerR family transcriptional regulator [Zoogloea sp.]